MICTRCGSNVQDGAPQCPNCGQRFAGTRRTFTTTTTSFRALEKRRARAQRATESLPYGIGDIVKARYEVRDLIGQGPLGVVYRVLDQELEIDVALKVIHPGLLAEEADRTAFAQTIRKVRKLSQQNIVRLYDDDQDGERAFFTMQLLEGLTLRKVIGLRQDKGQRFTVREVEPILGQICMALGHAHRHTVHGDLKPENVLILPDVAKLTDFAAFETVPRETFVQAQQDAEVGHYLAPEMAAGRAVDVRADIYSLGAILYELLTGAPFSAQAEPVSRVLGDDGEGAEGIDAVVWTATATEPKDRYDSAEAFSEALSTYIDGREIASVDLRSAAPLLPEDVTRKVQAPPGLQDDEPGALQLVAPLILKKGPPAAPADAVVPPLAESEESMVEEISMEDIEIDEGGLPSLDLRKPGELSFGAAAVTETSPPSPAGRGAAAAGAGSAPWLLRSNVGFVAVIFVIILGVVAGAYFVINRLQETKPAEPGQVTRLASDAGPRAPEKPVVVVEARPLPVPDAGRPAPEPDAARPAAVAITPPPTVVVPMPSIAVPPPVTRPAPPSAPPSVAVVAPATRAPAPPPTRAVEVTPPPTRPPAPATVAAPATKPPAPPSVAVVTPPPSRPEPREPTPPSAAESRADRVSCPAGTLLLTTGAFPKGSVKGRDISGAEAVALAKSGKAYCLDSHEFPGAGRPPRTSVTFNTAEGLCKGLNKRLCTDAEWMRGCRGAGGGAFPYGAAFDAGRCNTEDAEGEARALTASGKFGKCRSAAGALDMSGNAAEWTAGQAVRGGDYASADEDAACDAGGRRAPGSSRPNVGFRCCADPR